MSLIETDSIARRTLTLFYLVDTSGSMKGKKIAAVNVAMEECMPIIREISNNNADAEIKIVAMNFSSGVEWVYDEPKSIDDFGTPAFEASGLTSLGAACNELNSKMSKSAKGFLKSQQYQPVIILMSDGEPTDDWEHPLEELKMNNWFKHSIKLAIAIGEDASKEILSKFTGSQEAVFSVHDVEQLKTVIRLVSVTSSQVASQSSTTSGGQSKLDTITDMVRDNLPEDAAGHFDNFE